MVRYHAVISGRVQSVGFRFVTTCIARRYAVTGWVRNCSDGSVELEVQGDLREVEGFLAEVRRGDRYIRVDRMELTRMEPLPEGREKGFSVSYS